MIAGIILTPFNGVAILVVLAAALSYLNRRILRLSPSVGLTLIGPLASLVVVGLHRQLLGSELAADIVRFIAGIDFHKTLMEGMLSFLLFAGALHVDWSEIRRGRWPVLLLSTRRRTDLEPADRRGSSLITW